MGVSTEEFYTQDNIYFIDSNFKLFINEAHEKNRVITESERKMALQNGIRRSDLVDLIKKNLDKVDTTIGRSKKVKLSNELFETMVKYKSFLATQKKFRKTVLNKLLELVMYQDYEEGYKFLDLLFPNMDYHNVFFEELD